ncbi:hypothetical protein SIN8267_00396 [Sinobacterium norvegicum]|uniref:ShlB/FhaC/HecB family hemolysin secretion/activation protein n=1 Tax=Sinobacterium norvegicum TaxID=1641715 RepID=A0ABM9AAX1_9GAMM|nr:ShlB/FhaC/HecB family hemolysin secretion/activation protein [Sinobacterium norvegicum]CAH0990304.1 hypothetical protein SIN8267_00396 [Sinobacterium norvegicum]
MFSQYMQKFWFYGVIGLLFFVTLVPVDTEAQTNNAGNALRGIIDNSAPDIDSKGIENNYNERKTNQTSPDNDIEIPNAAYRDDLPRIRVEKFEFVRLPEFPESGITALAVKELVEAKRRELMKEDQIFASGYSQQELEEIAEVLQSVQQGKSVQALTSEDLQQLVAVMQRQQQARGLSYYDIEDVADQVTQFYRSNGLFLAKAYIPAQDVEKGVVKLTVIEGILGEVAVSGNKRYSAERLSRPFANQVGGLVNNKDIEESFYLLNDYPGLSLYGAFSAGSQPSETRLNINVREEQRWQLAIRGDNHGSKFTGNQRLFAIADIMNLTGQGDSLSIGYLKSVDPLNSDLGQLSYSYPIWGTRTRLNLSADYNEFTVESEESDLYEIEGVNSSYVFGVSHKFIRSRSKNLTVTANATDKETQLDSLVTSAKGAQGDHAVGGELIIDGDLMGSSFPMLNMASVGFSYGSIQSEVADGRDSDFYKFVLNTNSLFFLPIPLSDKSSRLVIRSNSQYSESALPAYEQASLGGGGAVRAFTVSEFSADSSAYLATELFFDVPDFTNFTIYDDTRLSDVFELGLFMEAAYGNQNSYTDSFSDSWAKMGGYGLMFKFQYKDYFNSQISVSKPGFIDSSIEGIGDDQQEYRTFADFTFYFK